MHVALYRLQTPHDSSLSLSLSLPLSLIHRYSLSLFLVEILLPTIFVSRDIYKFAFPFLNNPSKCYIYEKSSYLNNLSLSIRIYTASSLLSSIEAFSDPLLYFSILLAFRSIECTWYSGSQTRRTNHDLVNTLAYEVTPGRPGFTVRIVRYWYIQFLTIRPKI